MLFSLFIYSHLLIESWIHVLKALNKTFQINLWMCVKSLSIIRPRSLISQYILWWSPFSSVCSSFHTDVQGPRSGLKASLESATHSDGRNSSQDRVKQGNSSTVLKFILALRWPLNNNRKAVTNKLITSHYSSHKACTSGESRLEQNSLFHRQKRFIRFSCKCLLFRHCQ